MFTAVDELLRPLYPHLTAADQCHFLREYTSGRGFAHSETNRLILNLKKSPDRRDRPEWHYKELAIQQVAREFRESLNLQRLRAVTFVPIPPSKRKDDPLYDDRMLQVLHAMDVDGELDIRELLLLSASTTAAHATVLRRYARLFEHPTGAPAPPARLIVHCRTIAVLISRVWTRAADPNAVRPMATRASQRKHGAGPHHRI